MLHLEVAGGIGLVMAGIYIPNMEIPKTGATIFAIRPDGMVEDVMGCFVGQALTVSNHGRLIDAIAEYIKSIPAADVVERKKGKWVPSHKHSWQLDEYGNIDMWALDIGFHNGPRCVICHDTYCEHCKPDWKETECDTEHYECSVCEFQSVVKTCFCPNCGADMREDNL